MYGVPATIARTGYTGEDGFELFVDGDRAPEIWNALLRDHAADGLEPCGLGARDVLRLEAGMPLYGHELTEDDHAGSGRSVVGAEDEQARVHREGGPRGAARA